MKREFRFRFLSVLLGLLVLFGNSLVGQAQTTTQSVYPAGAGIRVKEVDGSPNVVGVQTLVFPNGTLTRSGRTVTVTVSGGGGTTINSTNGQLPYRVNSTTFGDSGIFSNGSGLIGINKTASLVAQLDVLSASTTRPAGRFQAASGTTGSQEMLGVYDGSAANTFKVTADGTVVLANGAAGTPSLAFNASSSTGFYWNAGASLPRMTAGGVDIAGWNNASFIFYKSIRFVDGGGDASVTTDGTNILAQRNGTNAQTFRVYNTYTDASNYERGELLWTGNELWIDTRAAGTGTARAIKISAGGVLHLGSNAATPQWQINTSGHFLATIDNTYDIGASGANRPRHYFGAGNGIFGSFVTATDYFTSSGTYGFASAGGTGIKFPGNGVAQLRNNSDTDFDRLQFGGTSASFPALKRSGAALEIKLADDSAYASLNAGLLQASVAFRDGSNYRIQWESNGAVAFRNSADSTYTSINVQTIRAPLDSPTQITADQNNYQAGTGRSLFYRLSSDASRTVTGFNPAGGINQDGELHYIINVGANNIVLANESASSTAANRFTNVTGSDITLAANEMAMLVYDNTSARWRAVKL